MKIDSFGFSTPRAFALVTVGSVLGLGVASGVFSTFYTTIQSNQTCSSGYGYESGYGYGYGYDCTASVSSGGGGGGGGSASYIAPTSSSTTTPLAITVSPVSGTGILAKDLSKNPYRAAIETLIRAGVMNNARIVAPNRFITRGEFLKLLAISQGYKSPVRTTFKFTDVPSTDSFYEYINYGVAMGWVNTKKSTFRPHDIITQGEIDKLIACVKKIASSDTLAKDSSGVTRGKAASDIVAAFFTK